MSGTPLSIVHTESSLGWGGQEIRILAESQGLVRRGHSVRLVAPAEARISLEAANWGVGVVTLPIGRKSWASLKAMAGWLEANSCDVLVAHSSTDSWLAALGLRMARRRVPLVRLRHISAPVPRNLASRWLYTRAAARIVTTGEALRRALIERNGFPAAMIESVPTGIDAGRFRPGGAAERAAARAKLGLPKDRFLAGIVATLRSWKGHRHLVEAMTRLPADIGLVIVGDGPQREALTAQIAAAGLGERVRMAGNQADVLPWLRAFDLFVLPSYANEGVPQALVQAMLAGLACVTTAAGAIPEVAEHERTAVVVPAEDPAALAAAIAALAADEPRRRELAQAARKHCVERFSLDRMLGRMERIYRDAAAGAARA